MSSRTTIYRRISTAAILAVGLFMAVNPGTALAQRWQIQPQLKVGAEYDDNSTLSSDAATTREIEGLRLEGALDINYATERTTFNVRPRLSSRQYDEEPDIDSNDQFVDFNWRHQLIKGEFGIRGNFANESVRTAERSDPILDEDNPEEIPEDDSSIVFTRGDRDRFLFAPEFSYEISERTSFGIQADYLDVSYDGPISGVLVDYSDIRAEAGFSRRLTERTSGFVGVGVRRFDNNSNNEDYDGIGAGMGFQTRLSETTRIRGEVGFEEAELTSTGESESIVVANFSVVRTLQTVTLLAQYSRSIAPGGVGQVSERDSLNFNVRKRFSERVAAGIGLRSSSSDSIVSPSGATPTTRDYLQLRAQLDVALTRNLSVEANYRYADIDRGAAGESADSNSFVLWLVWRPNPIVN